MTSVADMINMDDGGARAGGYGLEQTVQSPALQLGSMGTASFREPMARCSAQDLAAEDRRKERHDRGLVRFSKEHSVPDVGGLGWRTKTGHVLKNQAYYPQRPAVNKWDQAVHAGVNTWKEYHGPKLRTDADTMERLDRHDEEQERWEAKKTYVSTSRVQSLDRLYNRKLERENLEAAVAWAPHRRGHREVHSYHETFDGCMDEKPKKELRKVLTGKVLQRDREAIRAIASRVQKEETWKMVWNQMEQERQADVRADLRARRMHNDRLMALSGQPVREEHLHQPFNNCSQRSEELAKPVKRPKPPDITALTDFAGLAYTANNAHVMEVMFPGAGHRFSEEFRQNVTHSTEPGWPPPPAATTPRIRTQHQEDQPEAGDFSLSRPSIPVPAERFEHNMGSRSGAANLAKHSKVQFLRTSAPPAPDQKDSLLNEDWSPVSTLRNTRGKAAANDFARTSPSEAPPGSPVHKAKESLPAPTRSYVYPVIVESSPKAARPLGNLSPGSEATSPADSPQQPASSSAAGGTLRLSGSAPALLGKAASRSHGGAGQMANTLGASSSCMPSESEATLKSVCAELDAFEAMASKSRVPIATNFYGAPRGTGSKLRRTTSKMMQRNLTRSMSSLQL